jgi:hypothetical protein
VTLASAVTGVLCLPSQPHNPLDAAVVNEDLPDSSSEALAVADALVKAKAVLYGASWCSYTQQQRQLLGKTAVSKITYVECGAKSGNPPECAMKASGGYPTCDVPPNSLVGLQSLEKLKAAADAVAEPEPVES